MASEKNVVLAGYLIKSPPQEKLVAQWHRRYFVLLTSKIMEYYSSHERKPQDYLKSIDLSRCEDMIAPLPVTGRLHVIKLSVKTGNKLRDYFLDCSTEDNMNCWVTALAKTCGFCPVDDEDDQLEEEDFYASADVVRETTPPLPMQPPPISHHGHIRERSPPIVTSLRNLSPQPQPANNIKSWFSQNDILAAAPTSQDLDNNYHFLQDSSRSSTMERRDDDGFVQGFYDLNVDDETVYDMNKNPPPVWRPEDHHLVIPPPLPPNRSHGLSESNITNISNPQVRGPILPNQPPCRGRPLPPPKPQSEVSGSATFSPRMNLPFQLNFKDDPRFARKLEEKRQELYGMNGVNLRNRSISLSEVDDIYQECYESISDVREVRNPSLRVTSLHGDYSEAVNDPIDYLEFEASVSGSNSRAGSLPPDLPPKTDSMQREIFGMMQAPPHKTAILPVPARTIHPAIRTEDSPPPPPLPSRELINSTREPVLPPSIDRPQPTTDDDDEVPPPVPVRLSSNRSLTSLKDQPVFPGASRSPDHRPMTVQNQQQASHFSQVLTDMLSSSVNRKLASPSPRPASSPMDHVHFEISSEIYDDIQPVRSPQEEVHLDVRYDDIISPSPEPKGSQCIGSTIDTTQPHNDVFNNESHSSQQKNEVSVVAETAALSCEGQSATGLERALLQSLETKLHSRSNDSTNPVLLPPVKPKTSPEKKPKPRKFQAPPTKPKPVRGTQFPRTQQQLEQVIHSAPTSPKRVLSDPGKLYMNDLEPEESAAIVPLKPKVHRKPMIPIKPGVADKPNTAIKPAANGRIPLSQKQKQVMDSHGGPSQDEPIKPNVTEKPVLKDKPKVAQRSKWEDSRGGQLRAVPSAASATNRTETSSAVAPLPPTAPRATSSPLVAPRTSPPTGTRNGPLAVARTGPLLPPAENVSSSANKGHPSATGKLGAAAGRSGLPPTAAAIKKAGSSAAASRTGPPSIASRTGPPATASRTEPPLTASKAGPPSTASKAGPPPTASRTGPPLTASKAGPPATTTRTGPPLVQPKPPKPDTTFLQQPLGGGAATEPWQRPPVPIPSTAKPPPVRPKPTQVTGKRPLQTPLSS